ncbi:MAG TPA: cyclic nucleotide-binding domain-containing protein [Devosiaceae bacterium]|jgi:CRP-like cAMP-binding protein|nr:cyclic nucleotide-binding domain-containing protein [Devosiaceae bacterium]
MTDILEYCSSEPVVHFEPGETIILEGSRMGKLFILKQGQVEVIRRETQVSYIDEPGSIFGEMSVLLDMPHSATVKALSAVDAHVVVEAVQFLESRSEVAIHLATLLARRLYYTTTYLVDLQQQAEGKRRDLDMVDRILGSLLDETPEPEQREISSP